jgi:hypothetical protein
MKAGYTISGALGCSIQVVIAVRSIGCNAVDPVTCIQRVIVAVRMRAGCALPSKLRAVLICRRSRPNEGRLCLISRKRLIPLSKSVDFRKKTTPM